MADASTSAKAAGHDLEPEAAALAFARRVHLGQHRKQTGEQYVEHPIAVARLLAEAGYRDRVIVAAYLHDVVEKTKVELGEIRQRFGSEAAAMVDALSEDPSLEGYGERKRALRDQVLRSGRDPVVIYAADRVANLRDWLKVPSTDRRAVADRLGTTLDERLLLWGEDLDALTGYDPDLPFLGEIELALRELRAGVAES